jgi:dihydroorotate dehydrogenase electron transfer subunit
MRIKTELAQDAKAGQFVGVYPKNSATLLPRPISICEVCEHKHGIRLVYRIVGSGTSEFATYQVGDSVSLLGMLGNGFPVDEAVGKRAFLIGGGIGIPPLLELAKAITKADIFLGYKDSQLFLADELKAYGNIHIATEDGSTGTHGNVMDAIDNSGLKPDIIMACGPLPMLRAIKGYAATQKIKAYLSLEERMACGVGACLGCVCGTTEVDHHSHVHNARICTEGPVFEAGYVDI